MAIAAALMLLSCGSEHEESTDVKAVVPTPKDTMENYVTINLNMGTITQRAMTRATLTELNLTDLWIFDYVDGQLVTDFHQSSTETGFGSPSIDLEYGTHTLYFVASRGADPDVDTDAKTITWSSVRDTFLGTLELEVSPSTPTSQSVQIYRVVGRLTISVLDVVPDGSAMFSVSPSVWYYGINYQTGAAIASANTPISVNIPASYIGKTNLTASFYTISNPDVWQTDITATLSGSNAVISSIVIHNVPIQRNHITKYQGSILGAARSITVTSDDDWIEDDSITW